MKQSNLAILTILTLTIPTVGLGIDVYSPALPVIAKQFCVSSADAQLSIAIYLLGFALGQVLGGPLSDAWNRKAVLVMGLLGFILSSLLITTCHSIETLWLWRFVQGVAIAIQVVVARAIAVDVFSGKALQLASVSMVSAWLLVPLVAPLIGSYLQFYFSWHADFYFLASYGFIVLLLSLVFIPKLTSSNQPQKWTALYDQSKTIIRDKAFIKIVLSLALCFSLLSVYNITNPFIFQKLFQLSLIQYGHLLLIIGIACFMGSLGNLMLFKCLSQLQIINYACLSLFIIASLFAVSCFFWQLNVTHFSLLLLILLFAVGILYPNLSAACSAQFREYAGTASALRGVISMSIVAIITGVVSLLSLFAVIETVMIYAVLVILLFILNAHTVLANAGTQEARH